MHKSAFLLMLGFLLTAGCGGSYKPKSTEEKTGLPEASGGFVLMVGGETVTSDGIIGSLMEQLRPIAQASDFERFKEQAGPQVEQALMNKLSNILLYQKAKRLAGEHIEDALEKEAQKEVRKFVVGFGGDYARAEEALKRMGMDWQSFREYQKKMILSRFFIASQLPKVGPITYSELLDCYNEMKDEFFAIEGTIKLRLIDIEVAKLEVANPNRSRLERAGELADELVGRIRAGEDFGKLAKQYSHGHRRDFGGLWKPRRPQSLAEPYDILAAEAEKIQPGDIAGPIETGTGEHIFIMKLEEKRPKSVKPLREVQKKVEEKIIFDRRKQAIDELEAKLVRQAAVGKRSEFIDFCLERIYRISN